MAYMMTDHSSDSQSSGDDESVEQEWDQAELLELSDSVRAGLRGNNNDNVALALGVGPEADKLSSFLEAALNDEDRKYPTLDFETIEYARLDKMVDEILLFADTMGTSSSSGGGLPASSEHLLRFRADVSLVKSLRRLWRRRFREHFFMMDQHRCAVLVDGGRLKDVSFSNSLEYDLGKWHTPKLAGPVSEVEGNQTFEAGQYVLPSLVSCEREFKLTRCTYLRIFMQLVAEHDMRRTRRHNQRFSGDAHKGPLRVHRVTAPDRVGRADQR